MPTSTASPSAPIANTTLRAVAAASEAPSGQRKPGEPVYNSMPTPSFVRPATTTPVAPPVPAPTVKEIVTRPPPHTLAAGKYEAKPYEIWLIVVGGALIGLLYALLRVRIALRKKRRATDALTAVLRRPSSQPSR